MAIVDYGAIAFKNGKLISTDMFTPMEDMVGWKDTEQDVFHDYGKGKDIPIQLNGNFFAYIGDRDCTVAFYKQMIVIVERYKDGTFSYEDEWFNCTDYIWSKWRHHVFHGEFYNPVKVTKRNGYYVCKWTYKDNKYKVYFGLGVDFDSYKKWRIVNYYRSPIYKIKKFIRKFKFFSKK